ncbi:importin-4-like isoform X2 [Physella acuta]|uniref:importin-4-like isoform X2 n=1 Tax=Physella acuta TaxID=109671 RepID=UPI0027DB2684|nr:importin-4-like isoform X2 [Physella acuta]
MATPLEQILARLLEPDNDVIQKATLDLKEAFKDPSTLTALCQILGTSPQPQIRHYAAVLIRRKIHKSKQWAALSNEFKDSIRGNILQLLVQEQDKSARSAIGMIVGVIARLDTPSNRWPALFEFLVTFTKDEDPVKREVGMYVLSTVTSIAAEQMKPHMVSLLTLLAEALNDKANIQVCYLAIKSMTDLVFYIGDAEMKYVQNVVPRVLEVVQALAASDEEKACVALEFFDELLESEVAIIVPHLKPLVQYCLQIAKNKDYTDSLRVKAMSFVASLIRLKKKTVIKHHLVDPILQVLFPIICDDEEEEDDGEEEEEVHSPSQYAVQVIDTMALHLPPEKFLSKVTPMVETCLKSAAASHRRAAYLVMAVIVEGCGDYVMNKMLAQMLHTVCQGLNDPSHIVRNAALFAVGQFSEHLQPDISNYANELLPILFQYLNKSMEEADKNPKGVIKSHYALEMFCENLGVGILPYLSDLMNYLMNVVRNCNLYKPKELAISAIGAAANAAKEDMKPYFKDILEMFKVYLTVSNNVDEETKKLQLAAIDTLAVFARSIGEETFRPLATECIQLGLNLLNNTTDPDLRRCVYSLFAAISTVLKEEMGKYLDAIVNFMVSSMKSTEGIKAHYKSDAEAVTVFDEDEFNDDENLEYDDADDEEENYKLEGISVENAYLDEKEDACCALGEVALNTGKAFLPYLQSSYNEVLDLVAYPAVGIKKGAFSTLGQLCLCVHNSFKETNSEDALTALKMMIVGVVPKYLEAIKTEVDRTVVMTAVDALQELLDKIGQLVLSITGAADAILSAMKEIFTHKVACQDQEDDGEDETEAEFDSMLIESAGDVLPVMARIMGGDNFLPFFTSFVQDLLKRLKETSSTSEKSFAVGTLAEVIEACGPPVGCAFTSVLYPVFTRMTKDEDEEVRSNSVFALGVLAVNGGDAMISHYTDILKTLFTVMNAERNPRVLDNVCAAVCRMVWHSQQNVPLAQVLPVIVQLLPLKEDFEENVTVFTCLMKLYTENVQELIPYIPKIVETVAVVIRTEKIKEDTQTLLVHFIHSVHTKFPAEFEQVRSRLEPELVAVLDLCLSTQAPDMPVS